MCHSFNLGIEATKDIEPWSMCRGYTRASQEIIVMKIHVKIIIVEHMLEWCTSVDSN